VLRYDTQRAYILTRFGLVQVATGEARRTAIILEPWNDMTLSELE
jgi:hypothetical protein